MDGQNGRLRSLYARGDGRLAMMKDGTMADAAGGGPRLQLRRLEPLAAREAVEREAVVAAVEVDGRERAHAEEVGGLAFRQHPVGHADKPRYAASALSPQMAAVIFARVPNFNTNGFFEYWQTVRMLTPDFAAISFSLIPYRDKYLDVFFG